MEAPQVKRPQSVQTWRMPSALERQGDFSQTYNAQGQLDQHPRPAQGRPGVQRRDRRAGLLRRQHHPAVDDQPEPHAGHAQAHAAAGVRPADDAGQLQLRHGRSHRHSEAQQHRPDRLAADVERQLLVHVQGLVAGSARRAHHGGAVELAVVLRALQEHGPGLQRQLHQGAAVEPGVGHGLRQPAADGSLLPAERRRSGPRRAAPTRASRCRSSIPN